MNHTTDDHTQVDEMMTPEQRLSALDELQRRQVRNQRMVVRASWASVIVGAVILAALVIYGSMQVNQLTKKRNDLQSQIKILETQKSQAAADLAKTREANSALKSTLSFVPENEAKAAVERQVDLHPESAAVLPRIYMQIVNGADRNHANEVRSALERAGYIVLGIELVEKAASNLKVSDVRYYRDAERDDANRIATVLQGAGEAQVNVYIPQQFKNKSTVKPNHFEVWLAHRS